jgi:putative ABC transport system ATP-binding protein
MAARNTYDLPSFEWDSSRPLIEMREISKVFKTTAGEVPVLKTVSVDFYRSQFVSVVGRSGSGKSTLVNMLTGIDHPTRGEVRVADRMIHHLRESDMAVWRGRNLGIVFQFFQLLPTLSLLENVMLPMDFCDLFPPAERETRALDLLAQVGLEKYAHKMPGAVSGGQQQSVAVARALANDPPILIADEPTGNLDARTAEQVMQLFELQVAQGKTVIMVTHDRDLARRAQRILVIVDGELVNEALAQAFPEMRHRDLLALTRTAHLETYSTTAVMCCARRRGAYLAARQVGTKGKTGGDVAIR